MKRKFIVKPRSITASSNISLVDEFMKYHDDPDTYRNNPEGFDEMYDILDRYGDESEDVDVVFNRASIADQRKMIELLKSY